LIITEVPAVLAAAFLLPPTGMNLDRSTGMLVVGLVAMMVFPRLS
jgi:hypothetical protein